MSINLYLLLIVFFILIVTWISGLVPFVKRINNSLEFSFPSGKAFASGVFLGVGLIHMLSDSVLSFNSLNFSYPYPCLITVVTILSFLFMEHIGVSNSNNSVNICQLAVLATLMLSMHGFFEGVAIGVSRSSAMISIIFIAIIGHKWAESFSLSLTINQSKYKFIFRSVLFFLFSIMTPIGILFGNSLQKMFESSLLQPICTAIAAGTFIYMGVLHGLKHSVMLSVGDNLKKYSFIIMGFILMSIVAIWI